MHVSTELEYTYEPADLFEATTAFAAQVGTLSFTGGRAIVTLPAPTNPVGKTVMESATAAVRRALEARSLLVRRTFVLRGPGIVHRRPDGLRDIVIIAEPAILRIVANPGDVRLTDANGTVVLDTRAERIASESQFVEEVTRKADSSPTLRRMLSSYSNAVADPANELVHLYELCDAAAEYFGGEAQSRAHLGMSKADWKVLTRLANREPLRQGRHRGRAGTEIRDATPAELDSARRIAREILEAFARLA